MIEVKNLTKSYGDHVAVNNLSFRVEKGQIYGFLGPNGAGKSTTMNILTGYIAASGGTVTIDGKDIQKEPEEAKKKIGYLPEQPPLYMDMTVEEYLNFVAQLKKVSGKERKAQVEKVMGMVRITDMRSRLIRNLSKGYRQRVGLAQAVLGNPEVIILDEPSVGLDPKQIIEIRDLIRELGKSHTVILSSHILSEVSAVCDHIMIIAHGQLVASDSPEGLQKLMAGSMELQLTVRGSESDIAGALKPVSGIESVECEKAPDTDFAKVKIVFAKEVDAREEIFYALAAAKLPIIEMIPSKKSLEDIFLELTGDVKPVAKEKKGLFGGRRTKAEESGGQDVAKDRTASEADAASEGGPASEEDTAAKGRSALEADTVAESGAASEAEVSAEDGRDLEADSLTVKRPRV